MSKYLVKFADDTQMLVFAADREEAQDKAIEALEDQGLVHESILTIKRVAA